MKVDSVHSLFLHELKDAYSAEQQLTEALPKMVEKAQAAELKESLQMHLEETLAQVTRLEEIFALLNEKPEAHTCQAIQGIVKEGEEGMSQSEPSAIDLVITGSAARVEHYEQALYTGLYEMAKFMEHDEAADLLKETLKEEEAAGKKVEAAMKKLMEDTPLGM